MIQLTDPCQDQLQKLQQELTRNKDLYQQLLQVNQTLKPSLNQFHLNLQTKIKPSHDHLSKQRKAIYELLNYDRNLTLKDNFALFYQQAMAKRHRLVGQLSKFEKRERQLKEKAAHLGQSVEDNVLVHEEIRGQHEEMERHLANLQHEKFKKLCIRNSQQPQCDIDDFKQHDSSHFLSRQSHSLNTSYISSSSRAPSHTSVLQSSKSFHFHPDTFKNAEQIFDALSINNKPKSKQILNSLEKELNPLKLNEIIKFLEKEIENVKNFQLNPLMKQKQVEERRKILLKDKENRMINKLEGMKVHIRKFKFQKFGHK